MLKILAVAATLATIAGAQAQTLQPVKFAWTASPQTPQVDVAVKNGLFKEAGLAVQLVAFPTGREALEALIGGQVDLAYMAEFPVATAALRRQPLKVIADLSRYKGQRMIASAKFLDLQSVKDLAGRKIGTTLGTNAEYYTYLLLNHAGIKATIVNAGPADLVPALLRGDVEAAALFPTFFGAAKKTLGADYRELLTNDYTLHNIITASGAAIQKDPAMIEKFVGVLVKADDVVKADPAAAEQVVFDDMRAMMPLPDLQAMWQDFDYQTRLDPDLLSLIADEAGWIVDRGMVKAEKPTVSALREYVFEAPLKKASPASVTLP